MTPRTFLECHDCSAGKDGANALIVQNLSRGQLSRRLLTFWASATRRLREVTMGKTQLHVLCEVTCTFKASTRSNRLGT